MAKRTRRRRSKKRRPDFFKKYRIPLIVMGLAGCAVFLLVLLARIAEQPEVPELPPVIKPQVDYATKVHAEIEAMLSALDIDASSIQRDLEQTPARYTVEAEYPPVELIDAFNARLSEISRDYSARFREANSLTVEKSRRTEVVIHFISPSPELPSGPLVTVIMDDLGRSTYTAEALVSLPEQITFSILPGETQASRVAEMAYSAGHEVMLHVPMEPQGYPAINPGSDALFIKYRDDEIRSRFDQLLSKVPHATGANNHMGSRFTEDPRALAPVMQVLKEKGLFFIDSRTTGQSKVTEAADRFGVPTMSRDVFLDNVAEVEAIIREIRRLENKARRQGHAIGICHPYPETLEALRRALPGMRQRGIQVVPVSVLLQRQEAAQGS